MIENSVTLLFETVPQFAFAITLFYLCMKNGDRQREAYEKMIDRLHGMVSEVIEEIKKVNQG